MPLIDRAMGENAPHYQVAIIGAGAAGITIARKLGAQGVRVALIEGGTYDLADESQRMYEADINGHVYTLTGTRLRQFGGSTNHWGGYVRAMDEDTFQARNDLPAPYPGWPIAKSELDPYFYEALGILDIPRDAPWEPVYNPHDPFDVAARDNELKELYWNQSPPTRFRTKYWDEVLSYDSVDVLLNHSLIDIETEADGTMTAGVFTTLDGESTYRITADRFVLATGGAENPRLLQYFNAKNGTNYGNASGMLGKFFMEHPELDAADFVMMDAGYQHRVNDHAFRFFRPTRNWQLREHLAGCILRMYFTYEEQSQEIVASLERATRIKAQPGWRGGIVMMSFEQMPVMSNSIELHDTETDALGIPRTVLNWHLIPEDYRTPRIVLRRFAQMMLDSNLGRVRLYDWILDETQQPDPLWAKHHIGTTRMGTHEQDGCTDTNGLLFGTKNLYVAGSSLFPTAGYENPTLPVVQLALRFSDHLLRII